MCAVYLALNCDVQAPTFFPLLLFQTSFASFDLRPGTPAAIGDESLNGSFFQPDRVRSLISSS